MLRRVLGFTLQTAGTVLFAVSVAALFCALVYPQWGEWRHLLRQATVEGRPQLLAGEVSPDLAVSQAGVSSFAAGVSSPSAPPMATDTSSVNDSVAERVPPGPFVPGSGPITEDSAAQVERPRPDFSPLPLPSYGRPVRM